MPKATTKPAAKSDEESEPTNSTKTTTKRQLKGPSPAKTKTATKSSPKAKEATTSTARTRSKRKKAATQQSAEDTDESRGRYETESDAQDSDGKPIKKRKSLRLKTVRDREAEEESSGKESSAQKPNRSKNARKRRLSENGTSSPPKKKAKTSTSSNAADADIVYDPFFVNDTDYLVEIGIARRSGKNRRILHNKESHFDGKTFKWHKNKRYKLLEIRGHEIRVEPDEPLDEYPSEQRWWKSLEWKPVKRRMDEIDKKMKNGHDEKKEKEKEDVEPEEEEMPQSQFGIMLFECVWEEWGEPTWERWDTIKSTKQFERYCEKQGWKPQHELAATLKELPAEELQQVLRNMAVFGNPKDRRSLKILCHPTINEYRW